MIKTQRSIVCLQCQVFTKWSLWLLYIAAFFLLSVWYEIGFATVIDYLKYYHFFFEFGPEYSKSVFKRFHRFVSQLRAQSKLSS